MSQERLGVIRIIVAASVSAFCWFLGALWFLVTGLLFLPLYWHPRIHRLGQRWLSRAFTVQVRVLEWLGIVTCEYTGFEKLGQQPGGYILAPNHPSMWDVVFLLSRLDPMTCIFKASLIRNPLFIGGAVLAGLIPNSPPIRMIKRAVTVLRNGGSLLYFPEGTRTLKRNGVLNPLQGSMALVAKRAQVPVWPVFVTTNTDYLSKNCPVWRLPRIKTHIHMRVGDALLCGTDEALDDFNDRLRTIYLSFLK